MKLLLAILTVVTAHNALSMEQNKPIVDIRSWLVSVINLTNKNIKITAPQGNILEVRALQRTSGKNPLNLDPYQGEKNSSKITDIDTNTTLAVLDLNFEMQRAKDANQIKEFFNVSAVLNRGNSTFYSILPIARWENIYSADQFIDGNENWNFEVSIVLRGDNLEHSTINVVRTVKQTR